MWCRCSGLPGGGFAGGCSFVESLWLLICLLLGKCSRSLGGLVGVWGVVVVLVSRLVLSSVGGLAWVFHAIAFLWNSISVSLSAGGVNVLMSFQQVCLAVSSIPVWSVLAGPFVFGIPFVIFHTVIAAGDLFSSGSSCSQGPLTSFSFSTVRIISLLEVISIISVEGQLA